MPGKVSPIPAGIDLMQAVPLINKNFTELDQPLTLYNDRDGVPHISIGLGADGTSRIRVAKAGINVTTATDADLVFNSDQNTLKVVKKVIGSFTVSSVAGTATTPLTLTHGLGYVPATLNVVDITTDTSGVLAGVIPLPAFSVTLSAGAGNVFVMGAYVKVNQVNATSVQVEAGISGTNTLAGTVTSYILQETAN